MKAHYGWTIFQQFSFKKMVYNKYDMYAIR
jgi:hypothetical protein